MCSSAGKLWNAGSSRCSLQTVPVGRILSWLHPVYALKRRNHKPIHACFNEHTWALCCSCVSFSHSLSHEHTCTHTWAGSHGRRECEECSKPRVDVLTRPRLHAVTTGSVARPPCARPTGSNTRPGQPSSSSRPIIKQQAVLQLTSLPPSPQWCRGLRRGRKSCLLLQLLPEDALKHYIGGRIGIDHFHLQYVSTIQIYFQVF